jgi:hypothetical protein
MIIKYNDNFILKDWKEDDCGYLRTYGENKIFTVLVSINYYNINNYGRQIIVERLLGYKNTFAIRFYREFGFMEKLFGKLTVDGDIKNVKQKVDDFIIRMSKLKAIK